MFPSRFHDHPHASTRQYGRLVRDWVIAIGLLPSGYETHSMRRTKAAEIYKQDLELARTNMLAAKTNVTPQTDRSLPAQRLCRKSPKAECYDGCQCLAKRGW